MPPTHSYRRSPRASRGLGKWSLALALAALPAMPTSAAHEAGAKTDQPNVEPAPTYDPKAPVAFDEAERAIAHFKKPKDLSVKVWAAEPQLINPVALSVDNHGRVWLVETDRFRGGGVLDIRGFYSWVEQDLACRTVEDRENLSKKIWPEHWKDLAKNPDRLRLLEDSSKSGRCDKVSIWADGFNALADGIASGVLERKGTVYFTNIPNLWMMKDTKGEGVATERKVMSTGYGVHNSLEGHDLHGLRFGPDGRLYMSIGDRGFNVTTAEGKHLFYPDMGGVLRMEPDGSNLEVFAYGLRNPQKLCFDDHGNLFSGDNNSDAGDPAKWVYITEGSDTGWRIGYQHITFPKTRGALLMENVMDKEEKSTQLYMTPPIEHIGNGPSGCTFYPGTGMPADFNGTFFLCDFKGGQTNSGIWSFRMKPKGASFELVEKKQYLWQLLPTDVEFVPGGGFYVSDWINGWSRPNKGRIYHFYNEEASKQPVVAQVKQLLDDGFEKTDKQNLIVLLAHADQRVRQEAQFELADRNEVELLTRVATGDLKVKTETGSMAREDLAPIHAIWAIGQISRRKPEVAKSLVKALASTDPEVRSQAAKVLGESHVAEAFEPIVALLKDSEPRVQFFAAQALGKLGNKAAVGPLFVLLERNADKDAYIRHAAVSALQWINDPLQVLAMAGSDSASVRIGVLETFRRWANPEIARFLTDSDPRAVLEAARAVNDVPIEAARPALAKLIENAKLDDKVLRRAVNANFREGKPENAAAIAKFAASKDAPELTRVEALAALEEWGSPSVRDHITGLVWPLPEKTRDEKVAFNAIKPLLAEIVQSSPDQVAIAGLKLAEKTGVEPLAAVEAIVINEKIKRSPEVKAAALKALAAQNSPNLGQALKAGMLSKAPVLRREAIRLQTSLPGAAEKLNDILAKASPSDQQAVFQALPHVGGDAADQMYATWLDKLMAKQVPAASTLDLLEAAGKSKSKAVKDKLKKYEASLDKSDQLAVWRDCLEGGDAAAGRKIFFEKAETQCTRCHLVKNEGGGNVGPNLGDVGKRTSREYILESIVYPNAKIAPGFESAGIKLNNGKFYTGIVKSETDDEVTLDTGTDFGVLKIAKKDIKKRQPAPSPMPDDVAKPLSKQELRSLVEFLAGQKG